MTDKVDDLSDLLGGFYDGAKQHSGHCVPGQIVYVPVLEMRRRPFIADAIRADSYAHTEVTLHIREQNEDDFKPKEKRTPIKALHLDENHELVLSRAKSRPCLIIGMSDSIDIKSLPAGVQQNKALNALNTHYFLAPLYSVSMQDEPRAFGPVITARIKCLMYPQFLYIPRSGGIIKKHSVARLDHIFVHELAAGVEPTGLFVIDDVLALAREQLQVLLGNTPSEEYIESRDIMLEMLPVEYMSINKN